MRILFITATRLGDAVLSTGLLDHLLRTLPGARVTVACGPVAAGLFQRMPGLERVITITKRRYDLHWFDLWRRCVTTRWDMAVDLRGSAITLLLCARKRTIMRGGRRPGLRINHIGGGFGLVPPPMPRIWTAPADSARAAAVLGQPEEVIAMGPTANWSGKIWPAERFVALWHAIKVERPNARLAVFYGPGAAERESAATMLAIPGAIDAGGNFSLAEVGAMLQRCALFIGNDSGLMHLAAAAGTATLGLFGPSDSREYAPTGRLTAFVEAPGPQGSAPIAGLEVAPVLAAANRLLAVAS